jgi:hypothetical protein
MQGLSLFMSLMHYCVTSILIFVPNPLFLAVMLFISGILLFYTAIIVPVQICLWSYDDPCNAFVTLYFDVAVDSFFLVMLHYCNCAIMYIRSVCIRQKGLRRNKII